jgi:hypothetical protein
MSGASDEFDSSPGTRPGVRPPSPEALRLANVTALLNALATEYSIAARGVDGLESDERRVVLRKLHDHGRETARAIKAEALGLLPPDGGNGAAG